MAEEVAVSFLGKLAALLVDPIVRQFCYLVQYRSNIENLRNELDGLQASRQGVKIQVDAAENNNEIVDPAMQSWAKRVNEIEIKASEVIERTSNVDKKCLNVWCPNMKRRYLLSRNATKLTTGIGKLKHEGGTYAKSTHPAPPPGIMTADALLPELITRIDTTPAITRCETLVSRMSIFKQVMDALENERIRMIGISGIGGVGKTTFVNEICQKAREHSLFEQFAMTAVSQKQELLKIQDELAAMLGLKFIDNTISARAHRLRSRLTNGRKILVVLDDVWEEIPLKQVGIPVTGDRGGCKVIFTSRDKQLFSDMGTQLNVKVDILTPQESWELFKRNSGEYNQHLTAMEIVDNCGGTPIAVVSLAKALKKQAAAVLDSALDQLKKFSSGAENSGTDELVYKSIELCYNLLEDRKAKSLLVLCCLFPEDANIMLESLVRFDRSLDIEVKRRNVSYFVEKLRSFNLLGEGDSPGTVKVHDIVRDVCLTIEGLNKLPQDLTLAEPPADLEYGNFESRKSTYKKVFDALISNQIYTIGIHGMPGVGKTTMMYNIRERVLADNLFDEVAMTSVSQDASVSKVQAELGGMLGLTSTIWDKGDVSTRAHLLRERLTKGSKILVVLDDVWESFDLESIGVPVKGEIRGYKVVITTQIEAVIAQMGVQKSIRMELMTVTETWDLFREHAGLNTMNRGTSERLRHIGMDISNYCRGVVFTTAEVAYTLKNQGFNEWMSTLEKLRDEQTYGTVEHRRHLHLSYDGLRNPQAQTLLLLCCLLEADASIPIEKLVMCVNKVQLFEEVLGSEETRIKVLSLADLLRDASLLLTNDKDGSHGTVRVPHLVRQMCLPSLLHSK